MITAQSKQNIALAFHKAVRANLVRNAGDVCDISQVDIGSVDQFSVEKLLLITLSAFAFRLVMIFRIAETQAALSYYTQSDSAQTLAEVFSELANMSAGALNRDLSTKLPNLAMSTPCTVNGQCIAFLSELKPQYVASYRITINDSVRVQATLCLCCSAPLEVTDSVAGAQAEQIVGELEMF